MRQEQTSTTVMSPDSSSLRAPAVLVAVALGIVYVVWGSTYLAIRIAVQDLPPLSSAGWRFFLGALILAALLATRGGVRRLRATRVQLQGCAILGSAASGRERPGEHG